ncbi:molybdopterin-dependent oxidoreductase [Halomonas sp. McH1-25]|uniref:xanthine dehydrogenase family protein molybdopterin-binding subunit n=1 Tax=unclassified Halomonas TaxID=2609666 RepID=UPI001EF663A4|nr:MULTISPECIES: molybdopterin cofactor-binding domain-containing protein [unclassified Halomonas]MCG7600215.1 molybdopterin-dependent oxidoreductase [Halomonas sp. McH1-25]MCP1343088.1 molybdopterin-dependent oxidoreductase [Halomonas sp. FL8]MCP1360503.1 molybdopterin-dependent oxidoreductase [Halomonas sp. BBD45]
MTPERSWTKGLNPDLSRRTFVQGVGALAVGFALCPAVLRAATIDNDVAGVDKTTLAKGAVDAWLVITANNELVIYSGKVELGTGVATALRQIVAEELAMPFAATRLIQGDTELTPDQGYTAGSATIQQGSDPMRRAAATARRLLIQRAADTLGVTPDRLVTEQGRIHRVGEPTRSVSYGELIGDDQFTQRIDESPAFVDPQDYTLVGQSVPRVDIPPKVFGNFVYMQDVTRPGMWHARVIRPPTVGTTTIAATLESIDEAALPAGVQLVRRGNFLAVVAETEWQAIRAAEALPVTWLTRAGLPRPDALYSSLKASGASEEVVASRGDAQSALSGAPRTFQAEYHWPYQAHDSIGPSCAVADVSERQATVWSGTQGVYPLRSALADLLGMDEGAVHVIYVEASGCYGHNGADDAAADAALISQAVRRPVRVQWSRQDEHGWGPKGPAMVMRLDAALNDDDDIVAWQFANWSPTHTTRPSAAQGAANLLAGNLALGLVPDGPQIGGDRNAPVEYAFDNYRVVTHWLPTATSPLRPSALRTLGAMQNTFANESFIDELAFAAKADPVALRLRYLKDPRAIAVVKAATQRAGWKGRPMPQRYLQIDDKSVAGQGMAFAQYENQYAYVAAVAEVELSVRRGVRVRKVTVAHDCGRIINPDGLRNQIEGNVLQATSRALKEEILFDHTGITSLEWGAYPLLTFAEIPEVEIILIDRPEQPPFGAGEPTSAVVPAAIANAIFDASGMRLRTAPFTRERLSQAFQALG